MNLTRRPALLALGIVLVVPLAACSGDDDDATAAEDTAESPEPSESTSDDSTTDDSATDDGGVAMQPAAISFDAQESDGTSVVVATVDLPAAGFVAVHSDGDGGPGPVIGNSDLLPAGTSTDVAVALDEPLTADTTLYPMVHIDTDANGRYEFGVVEGVDGPGLTAGGDVAVVGADVTFTGEATANAAGDDPAADPNSITIAGFAFSGVTEVPVGTTVVVTNEDDATHTWTAVEGAFASGELAAGDSFEFTFTEAGTYEYFCSIHPNMTGTIVVTG